jgi:hypothetical protein
MHHRSHPSMIKHFSLVIHVITPIPIPRDVFSHCILFIFFIVIFLTKLRINIPVNINKWEIWLFIVWCQVMNLTFFSLEKPFVDGQSFIPCIKIVTLLGKYSPLSKCKAAPSQWVPNWNQNVSSQIIDSIRVDAQAAI